MDSPKTPAIEVGRKIPFRRGTSIPTTGNVSSSAINSLLSSNVRIDVSLLLKIKPQINERGKIRLEIDQKIEDLVGIDEPTGQPITSKRAAKTMVVVEDQQTVVLGGLLRDRTTEGESKIPFLSDIPIIGWLFKQRTSQSSKVNLLLVLTPYIINDSSDFQRIFERKMKEYESFAAEYYGNLPRYRAFIDYEHKVGPLGMLFDRIDKEMNKIENGGSGSGEILIKPKTTNNSQIKQVNIKDSSSKILDRRKKEK